MKRKLAVGLVCICAGVLGAIFGFYLLTLPTHYSCTYYSAFLYGRPCGYSWLQHDANATVYLLGFEFPLQIYYDFGTPAIMIGVFWSFLTLGMWLALRLTAGLSNNTTSEGGEGSGR